MFGFRLALASVTLAYAMALPVIAATQAMGLTAENPMGRTFDASLPLVVHGEDAGELPSRILGDGRVLVAEGDFADRMAPYLNEMARSKLAAVPDEGGFVSLNGLHDAGFDLGFDPRRLQIVVRPNADQSARRSFAFGRRGSPRGPKDSTPSPGLSGFVNLSTFVELDYEDDRDVLTRESLRLSGDAALHFRGVTLEGEGSYNSTQGFRRSGTRMIYDDGARLVRYSAGDVDIPIAGFQRSASLLGISATHNATTIPAANSARPIGAYSFRLDQAARVEVALNDSVIRTLSLQPGSYDLRELGFRTGLNELQLVITDADGRREVLDYRMYLDSSLLPAGRTEFGAAAGVTSRIEGNDRDYDGDPAVSFYVRQGIRETFTAGVNAQSTSEAGLLGIEADYSTLYGVFKDIDAAVSSDYSGEIGYALDLVYELPEFRLYEDDAAQRRFSLSAEHRSTHFRLIETTEAQPLDLRLTGNYSQNFFGGTSLGLSASYERGSGAESRDRTDIATLLSWPIDANANLTATLGYSDGADEDGIYSLLTLSINLDGDSRNSLSLDSRKSSIRFDHAYSPRKEIGVVDYSVTMQRDEDQDFVGANIGYTGNRFEAEVDHNLRGSGSGQVDTHTTKLGVDTALVFADGAFALSRPVNESFAIIRPHVSLADKRVMIDPADERTRYYSDFLGPAVVNDISAYSNRNIAVDIEDLPLGYDIGSGSFDVRALYKAGYVFTVGSDYSVTLVASALDAGGEPVALAVGSAKEVGLEDGPVIQVFTNRTGRLVAQGLRPGVWEIELRPAKAEPQRYRVTVGDDVAGMVRSGALSPLTD